MLKLGAAGAHRAPGRQHVLGNKERFVRIGAIGELRAAEFLLAGFIAVGEPGALLLRHTLADDRFAADDAGPVGDGVGGGDGRLDGIHVVAVDGLDMPVIGLKALRHVVAVRKRCRAID